MPKLAKSQNQNFWPKFKNFRHIFNLDLLYSNETKVPDLLNSNETKESDLLNPNKNVNSNRMKPDLN